MALDTACILRMLLGGILYGNPHLEIAVDLRSDNLNVIRAVHMLGNVPQEKRLQAVIESTKELVFSEEITSISYAPGSINISDEMTKITTGNLTHMLLMENKIKSPSEEIIFSKYMRAHTNKQYFLLQNRYPELNWE